MRRVLERAWAVFGDARFKRRAGISNGHPHNLRRSLPYKLRIGEKDATRPAQVVIGERRHPRPEGHPDYVPVNSVNQGNLGRVKVVDRIDVADEASCCR